MRCYTFALAICGLQCCEVEVQVPVQVQIYDRRIEVAIESSHKVNDIDGLSSLDSQQSLDHLSEYIVEMFIQSH